MALPVTLDEAKAQLRVEGDDQDTEILGFIQDAADWVEGYTGLILEPREVTEQVQGFRPVTLRSWPIAADAVPGVAYIDSDGVPAAITGARLNVSSRPARIMPPSGSFWPFRNADQIFTITIQAGFADPADVPRAVRRAMLLLIGAYDDDREGGETLTKAISAASRLCQRLKRHTL